MCDLRRTRGNERPPCRPAKLERGREPPRGRPRALYRPRRGWPALRPAVAGLLAAAVLVAGTKPGARTVLGAELPAPQFVRGGLHWAGPPGQSPPGRLTVDGSPVTVQPRPGGGWLAEVDWTPRATLRLAWSGGATGAGAATERVLRAPLRPTPLAWHVLDWPPGGAGEAPDLLTALQFSADGRWLALGSQQGRLAVLNVAAGVLRWSAQRPGRVIRQLAFSADGAALLVGEQGPEGRLAAYDLERKEALPLWHWDAAAALGSAPAVRETAWGWVQQPGVYRLAAVGGDVLAAFTRSWATDEGRSARAVLVRLDALTGRVRWRYPARVAAPAVMTWFALDDGADRVALPLQPPLDAAGAARSGGASRIEIVDGHSGAVTFGQDIVPLPPFPFAGFWRGVALHPNGRRMALATEDGRGLLYAWGGNRWRRTTELTLVRPMHIAGHVVTATNGTLVATDETVIFATGPSYVPVAHGAGTPTVAHRAGNTLFAYDWQGTARWAWPMGNDLQGLALSALGGVLAVLTGREAAQPVGDFNGVTLLRLHPADDARRLLYRYPLQGRALYDGLAIAPDGRWVALGEAPRLVQDDPLPRGRARVWLLR